MEFVWPENPQYYHMEQQRKAVYTVDENGKSVFSGMEGVRCVITGKGVFAGADAYTQYKALAALLSHSEPGVLVHPVWGSCSVYFTALTMTQEPKADYVAYEFEFQQVDSNGDIPK
jgi:hypothetical protein